MIFNPGASSYTFSDPGKTLTLSGAGVVNNSAIEQNFSSIDGTGSGIVQFTNSASAGEATFTNFGAPIQPGSATA